MKKITIFIIVAFYGIKLNAQTDIDVKIDYCTPKGTPVDHVYKRLDELTDIEKTSIENEYRNNYPHCIIIGTTTKKYNCHGYAFSVADGNETLCIAKV